MWLCPSLLVSAPEGYPSVSYTHLDVYKRQDEDCPLAFAVIVENGGFGISSAGPVAEAVLQEAAKSIRG